MSGGNSLTAQGGRYVFGQTGDSILSAFMLDTQTGRLWKYEVDSQHHLVLSVVPYAQLDGTFNTTPSKGEEGQTVVFTGNSLPGTH
jgi:hypothetical protein